MGLIVTLKEFARRAVRGKLFSEAKVDSGFGALITVPHFEDAGSESVPLPDDMQLIIKLPNSGGYASAGYADTNTVKTTLQGEKRIYSRLPTGAIAADIILKNSGEVIASGAFSVENGATGVSTGANVVTFVNGIAVAIT